MAPFRPLFSDLLIPHHSSAKDSAFLSATEDSGRFQFGQDVPNISERRTNHTGQRGWFDIMTIQFEVTVGLGFVHEGEQVNPKPSGAE